MIRPYALLKQGWNEIPEIVGSTAIALIGLGLGGYSLYSYTKNEGHKRRYKQQYTVFRPDDPRLRYVRMD